MSNRLPPKYYGALASEIGCWSEEGIISPELAARLIERYPAGRLQSNAITVMSTIGAVLIGLGTLLYIGANWQTISALWKIFILVVAIVGANLSGWLLKFEPGNKPKLGSALLLLGALFYGAGIWLVAQIFNLQIDYTTGLVLWWLGTAASALITRSTAVGVLSAIILAAWALHAPDLNRVLHALNGSSAPINYEMAVGTGLGLAMAWYLRSSAMAWVTLLATNLWIILESTTGLHGLVLWGFALFAGWLWLRENFPALEQPFRYISATTVLGAVLTLSCIHTTWVNVYFNTNFFGLLACALSAIGILFVTCKERRNEALSCLLLLAYFLYFGGGNGSDSGQQFTRVLAYNFMSIACISGLAWSGARQLQNPGLVNTAIVFSVFYIICRYFDFFFSMLDRSLFFVVGGVILMTIGAVAEKSRRTLIGRMTV